MFKINTEMNNKGIELADVIVGKNRDRQNHVGTILNFALNYFNCWAIKLDGYDIDYRGLDGEMRVKQNSANFHYSNRRSEEVIRFLIAVQIGTYGLGNFKDGDIVSFNRNYLSSRTTFDSYPVINFAANLLIPNKELADTIKSGVNTIHDLAAEFKVTSGAMRFKINNCQLFDKIYDEKYADDLVDKNLFNDKKRRILKV